MGIPFECDLCHFRNLNNRDPLTNYLTDLWTLLCIRRACLDAFWSRESGTVLGNLSRFKLDYFSGLAVFSMECQLPVFGSAQVEDKVGMWGALFMLNASLRPGRNAPRVQFDVSRRTLSWLNAMYQASSYATSEMVLTNQDKTFHIIQGPVTSLWRERNTKGFKRRVGIQRKQNEPLTMALMLAILKLAEEDWKRSKSAYEKKTIEEFVCFMIIGFMLSLRGEEVPLASLTGMLEYWSEGFNLGEHERHVMITLKGKFKGEDYLRWHCLPLADVSKSKVPSRRWLSRLVSRKISAGKMTGWLFARSAKKRGTIADYDPTFRAYLTRVRMLDGKLFLKGVEIGDYSLRRSLRRGATSHAMNNEVHPTVIDEINRWRTYANARGCEAGFTLAQVYSSVRHTIPTKIKYSRSA